MLSMKLFHMHLHQNDDKRINNNYFCKILYLIFITYQNHVTRGVLTIIIHRRLMSQTISASS